MRRAQTCAALITLALAFELAAPSARADKMTDAEELFRRAKALMNEKKDKEACPLFEESEKLDPQMGTLLNLAICHENIGRVASAWGEFRAVEQMAKVANREDRVKLAHDRAAKLENRLPRIKITLPADNKVEGIVVKVDGEAKAESLWSGVAVDPGVATIETSAPGKKTVTQQVKIEVEGATVPYVVPKLEDAPLPPLAPSDLAAENERKHKELEKQVAANKSRRTKGFIVGGVGVGVMAAGGVFGVIAVTKKGDGSAACPAPCIAGSPEAADADNATDRALLFANIANVAIPIGAVVTLIGGYLILSSGPTTMPPERTAGGLQRDLEKRTLLSRGFVGSSPGGAALGLTW